MLLLSKDFQPNPRLQRTRSAPLRSPLNRKPFGELKVTVCLMLLLGVTQGVQAQPLPEHDNGVLPSIPISEEQILRVLVPNYEQKLMISKPKLADRTDPMAWWHTYEARVVSSRRTNLGVPGEDFLIVAIQEIDEPCHGCYFSIFGGVDLRRVSSMGSFRSSHASYPESGSLVLVKAGKPWRLAFKYWFHGSAGSGSIVWERAAAVARDASGAWRIEFGEVLEHYVAGDGPS